MNHQILATAIKNALEYEAPEFVQVAQEISSIFSGDKARLAAWGFIAAYEYERLRQENCSKSPASLPLPDALAES